MKNQKGELNKKTESIFSRHRKKTKSGKDM